MIVQNSQGGNPNVPGQLFGQSLCTKKKFIIGELDVTSFLKYSNSKIGILSFSKIYSNSIKNIVLSKNGDVMVAENFFSALRTLDTEDIDLILGEYVPKKGIGKAINDRLKRATNN